MIVGLRLTNRAHVHYHARSIFRWGERDSFVEWALGRVVVLDGRVDVATAQVMDSRSNLDDHGPISSALCARSQ